MVDSGGEVTRPKYKYDVSYKSCIFVMSLIFFLEAQFKVQFDILSTLYIKISSKI